jgi:HK97 family phage portal protein
MGLFGGPARSQEPAPVERSFTMPSTWQTVMGTFADQDPAQASTAMQSVAIRSAVDLIASLVSELPIVTYAASGQIIPTPENVQDPGGDGEGSEDWLYRGLSSWLLSGNLYGGVTETKGLNEYIVSADLFNPDDVVCTLPSGQPVWRVGGIEFPNQNAFLHRRVNPIAGRVLGLSPIENHAAQIGVSLAATKFGRQWFTEGAHPSGMLSYPGNLSPTQTDEVKARLLEKKLGSREPLVLGGGWKFDEIQISPEESQFLQTSGASEAQCARIYGPGIAEILGYATGGSMTYANIVDRRQDLLVFTLNRWIRRSERLLTRFTPSGVNVHLNREALLEATTLQRYEAHASALTNKWMTVNEVRDIEKKPRVAWGDVPDGTPAPEGGN